MLVTVGLYFVNSWISGLLIRSTSWELELYPACDLICKINSKTFYAVGRIKFFIFNA